MATNWFNQTVSETATKLKTDLEKGLTLEEVKQRKELNREVIDELIDCIYVHEGGNVAIRFKYQDEYERVLRSINKEMEVTL